MPGLTSLLRPIPQLHHLPSFLLTPSLLPSALTVHQQLLDLSPSLLENGLVLLMPHQQRNALALLLSTSLQNPRSTLSISAIDLIDSQTIDMLVDYWEQAIFSPDRVWESVFPTIVSVDKNSGGGKPDKGYKGRLPTVLPPTAAESPDVALEEQETLERETNLTQGALLSLASSLSTLPSSSDLPESLHNLLKTSQLYSTLSSPQSLVRKSAWGLVGVLAEKWESVCKDMIESLSVEVGKNAWSEQEGTVRASMGEPVVLFFKSAYQRSLIFGLLSRWRAADTVVFAEFPDTWELSSPDDDDEDDIEEEAAGDDTASPTPEAVKNKTFPTYESFLAFLQSGCRGAAVQSYPLLVILLSTLPESVRAFDHLLKLDFGCLLTPLYFLPDRFSLSLNQPSVLTSPRSGPASTHCLRPTARHEKPSTPPSSNCSRSSCREPRRPRTSTPF